MNLLILGSGTILQEHIIKSCSGYFLDRQFLFDCGPGIWKSLLENKVHIEKINYIFLTHFHVDHTSDLAAVLLNRYLQLEKAQGVLTIGGPVGLRQWIDRLAALHGEWIKTLSIEVVELADDTLQIQDYLISSQNTFHTASSICYRIVKNDTCFFYSGDMDYQSSLIPMARSADLAVIEASNKEENHITGHLTPQSAIRFASEADIKKVLLTHMYPDVLTDIENIKNILDFSGQVLIAKDNEYIEF